MTGGALARCVGDVDQFETDHWGRSPLLRRRRGADGFDDVLTIDDVDSFLASGIRRPVVRVVRDGVAVPAERYTGVVRLGGADIRDVVDPVKVAECFAEGATVVAQSLHRTHPKVRDFTARLADDVSHPIQANAYLTPPVATGLAPHADRHDVIVLQLAGSKRWSVDGLGEFDLHPGDTLYIPAGHDHAASSNQQTSLHLTLGIIRVTYRAVLERILRDGPGRLDNPLPLRYRSPDLTIDDEIGALIDDVREHLVSVDPAEVARSERQRVLRRPPVPGALASAIELVGLDRDSVLTRRGPTWSITTDDSTVRVENHGHWLTAPSVCSAALAQLDHGDAVAVRDLRGLDLDSALILSRRLIGAGFCSVATSD